jgi:hypothetical protein
MGRLSRRAGAGLSGLIAGVLLGGAAAALNIQSEDAAENEPPAGWRRPAWVP